MVAHVGYSHDGVCHEFFFNGQIPVMHPGTGLPIGEIRVLERLRAGSDALRFVESHRVGAVSSRNDRGSADQAIIPDTVGRLRGRGQLIVPVEAGERGVEPHAVVPAVDGNQIVVGAEFAAKGEALSTAGPR